MIRKMKHENTENMVLGHNYFMKQALKEALKAKDEDEVPIGCVVVLNNTVIGRGYNQTERLNDPTAHAEMIAITAACHHLGAKYLTECTVYVTIEPCTMCAGALFWTRPAMVVFGAKEPKVGYSRHQQSILHPGTVLIEGILEEECREVIRHYFIQKRNG
jgi:tRNA(adenine34) deaminase